MDVSGNEILKNYFLKKSKEEVLEAFGKSEIILKAWPLSLLWLDVADGPDLRSGNKKGPVV